MPVTRSGGGGGSSPVMPASSLANFEYNFAGPYPGRYNTDTSGGSTAISTGGTVLNTAASGSSYRAIFDESLPTTYPIFDHDPYFIFTGVFFFGTGGVNGEAQVGIGAVYNYFNTTVDSGGSGFGFYSTMVGTTFTTFGYAKNAAGSVQTVDLGFPTSNHAVYRANLTSGSKVEFFIDGTKYGEITTGLPDGAGYQYMWRAAIHQSSGTNGSELILNLLNYGYGVTT